MIKAAYEAQGKPVSKPAKKNVSRNLADSRYRANAKQGMAKTSRREISQLPTSSNTPTSTGKVSSLSRDTTTKDLNAGPGISTGAKKNVDSRFNSTVFPSREGSSDEESPVPNPPLSSSKSVSPFRQPSSEKQTLRASTILEEVLIPTQLVAVTDSAGTVDRLEAMDIVSSSGEPVPSTILPVGGPSPNPKRTMPEKYPHPRFKHNITADDRVEEEMSSPTQLAKSTQVLNSGTGSDQVDTPSENGRLADSTASSAKGNVDSRFNGTVFPSREGSSDEESPVPNSPLSSSKSVLPFRQPSSEKQKFRASAILEEVLIPTQLVAVTDSAGTVDALEAMDIVSNSGEPVPSTILPVGGPSPNSEKTMQEKYPHPGFKHNITADDQVEEEMSSPTQIAKPTQVPNSGTGSDQVDALSENGRLVVSTASSDGRSSSDHTDIMTDEYSRSIEPSVNYTSTAADTTRNDKASAASTKGTRFSSREKVLSRIVRDSVTPSLNSSGATASDEFRPTTAGLPTRKRRNEAEENQPRKTRRRTIDDFLKKGETIIGDRQNAVVGFYLRHSDLKEYGEDDIYRALSLALLLGQHSFASELRPCVDNGRLPLLQDQERSSTPAAKLCAMYEYIQHRKSLHSYYAILDDLRAYEMYENLMRELRESGSQAAMARENEGGRLDVFAYDILVAKKTLKTREEVAKGKEDQKLKEIRRVVQTMKNRGEAVRQFEQLLQGGFEPGLGENAWELLPVSGIQSPWIQSGIIEADE